MTSYTTENNNEQTSSHSTNSVRDYDYRVKVEALKAELADALESVSTEEDEIEPSTAAVQDARSLILQLIAYDAPVVSCFDDGGICFQWTKRPFSIVTLTLYGDGFITYTASFREQGERHRGTVRFIKAGIPKVIEEFLGSHFASEEVPWIATSPTMSQ